MKIFLIYGGKSAEHDISIISAFHILGEIYYNFYQVQTIYITPEGKWLKGRLIKEPNQIPTQEEMRQVGEKSLTFPS